MPNQFFSNVGHFYAPHNTPILLDCNFIVDSANGNGLGLRSLKGPKITNVFMHTSSTPAPFSPNPAPGYIFVQLNDTYNRSFSGFNALIEPLSGSNINISGSAVMTVGNPYVITSVGTSTQANWQAVGLPAGVVPAVGLPFIASVTGGGTGTGTVQASVSPAIQSIVSIGDTAGSVAATVGNAGSGLANSAGYLVLACLGATAAGNTALIPTAPADGTVISLAFYLSGSSVKVAGE